MISAPSILASVEILYFNFFSLVPIAVSQESAAERLKDWITKVVLDEVDRLAQHIVRLRDGRVVSIE